MMRCSRHTIKIRFQSLIFQIYGEHYFVHAWYYHGKWQSSTVNFAIYIQTVTKWNEHHLRWLYFDSDCTTIRDLQSSAQWLGQVMQRKTHPMCSSTVPGNSTLPATNNRYTTCLSQCCVHTEEVWHASRVHQLEQSWFNRKDLDNDLWMKSVYLKAAKTAEIPRSFSLKFSYYVIKGYLWTSDPSGIPGSIAWN